MSSSIPSSQNKNTIYLKIQFLVFLCMNCMHFAYVQDAYTKMFNAANGDRADAPNIAIVVTDGRSGDRVLTTAEAQKLRNQGVQVTMRCFYIVFFVIDNYATSPVKHGGVNWFANLGGSVLLFYYIFYECRCIY